MASWRNANCRSASAALRLALGAGLVLPALGRAQECTRVATRSTLGQFSGARIRAIEIASTPTSVQQRVPIARVLHTATNDRVIRRQLLFVVGDTIDTLAVGETLRRLRGSHSFSDVVLEAVRCDSTPSTVALTVVAQDAWSLHPTAVLRSMNTGSVGIQESNLLGTGRSLAFSHEAEEGMRGNVVRLSDPWILSSRLGASLRLSTVPTRRGQEAGLRLREYSIFDPWRAELGVSHTSHEPTVRRPGYTRKLLGTALGGWVFRAERTGALSLQMGAEFDSSVFVAPPDAEGARTPHAHPQIRSFAGVDLGFARRTVSYDTVTWLGSRDGITDVPLGLETDVLLGVGYDRIGAAPAARYDAWLGRMWVPRRGLALSTDVWASGFAGPHSRPNSVARAAVNLFAAAPRGTWSAHVGAEHYADRDLDLRATSIFETLDLTLPALPRAWRFAERTAAAGLERAVHVMPVGRTMIDVGAFTGASYRSNPPREGGGAIAVGVVGIGLRAVPANASFISTRADLVYPTFASAAIARRPYVALTIGATLDGYRARDGRRAR